MGKDVMFHISMCHILYHHMSLIHIGYILVSNNILGCICKV